MIDHSGFSVSDIEQATAFYNIALGALGYKMLYEVPKEFTGGVRVLGYGADRPQFWINEGGAQVPPLHFAFSANLRADVDAFYKAAINAGGIDNGAPGIRVHYHPDYYGAFVRDLDGNNIEAVCHKPE